MAAFDFAKYCTPAQLYLILAGIGLLTAFLKNFRVITLAVSGIFVVLWAWILNFICRKGSPTISWVLVLLPIVVQIVGFLLAKDAIDGNIDVAPEVDVKPKEVIQEGLNAYRNVTGRSMGFLKGIVKESFGGINKKDLKRRAKKIASKLAR